MIDCLRLKVATVLKVRMFNSVQYIICSLVSYKYMNMWIMFLILIGTILDSIFGR